jgi:hypothetical protein
MQLIPTSSTTSQDRLLTRVILLINFWNNENGTYYHAILFKYPLQAALYFQMVEGGVQVFHSVITKFPV